jgi:hypothetical protein
VCRHYRRRRDQLRFDGSHVSHLLHKEIHPLGIRRYGFILFPPSLLEGRSHSTFRVSVPERLANDDGREIGVHGLAAEHLVHAAYPGPCLAILARAGECLAKAHPSS